MGNIKNDRFTIDVYFSVQSGWLISTGANYFGKYRNGFNISKGVILGDRDLTYSEINILSSVMNIINTSINFMTSDSSLISLLNDKVVAFILDPK